MDGRERAGGSLPAPRRFEPTEIDAQTRLGMDLKDGSVRTVIWATGYRPDYSWLDVPVLDRKGRIRHDGGVVAAPGMYVMGLPFMRRRKSSFIDGVGDDAGGSCRALDPRPASLGRLRSNDRWIRLVFQPHYDAVIVGARCAGAATAMLLARAGEGSRESTDRPTAPTRCRLTP